MKGEEVDLEEFSKMVDIFMENGFNYFDTARIYFDGIGTPKAPEYAKWYMDKLRIPPIYAIKLAYNLRNVTSKEPLRESSKNRPINIFALFRPYHHI